ncbi:MAG: hypothetical protein JNG89_14780 [Planctomycetaceae bacterium]|nr:hypothetical protein [Planctomycetaceae bacterium]
MRWRIREAVPTIAALLGATSYLLALNSTHRWWVVVLVSPLALVGAVLVAALLWPASSSRLARTLLILMGAGWAFVGITEPERLGTLLMGAAFLLLGMFPPRDETPA